MIRQFRTEAASASQRLNGGAMDDRFHRRRMTGDVEAYAARFAGAGSAVQNPQTIEVATKMLDELSSCPSLGLLPTAARKKIIGFIVHEKHSIVKAQLAAARLRDLLAWSQSQGETVTLDELISTLELDETQIAELRRSIGLGPMTSESRRRGSNDDDDTDIDGQQQQESKKDRLARKRREAAAADFERDTDGNLITHGSNNISTGARKSNGDKSDVAAKAATTTANLTVEDVPPPAQFDEEELAEHAADFLRRSKLNENEIRKLGTGLDSIAFNSMASKILHSISSKASSAL
jgi:hypothetical protein